MDVEARLVGDVEVMLCRGIKNVRKTQHLYT